MVRLKIKFAVVLLAGLCVLSMRPTATYGYDDYEWYWVDSQNPEVQRMIREVCVFPLEDNLMLNLRILFYALGRSFRYDYTFEHAWQSVPEMFRQRKGVCCDFARLYYSLLRGIGWPEHCIQIVYGPIYNLFDDYIGARHAWVEIKIPSPSGTILALSANQSIVTLEGQQFVMGFNDTMVTLPEITEERIREVQTLGFFTRDGWIPIDPTASVCTYGLFPFLADLYLVFGYGAFLLSGWRVHFDEIYPYYANADRENPSWHNLAVTLEPQESFNVSYLHSVELYQLTRRIWSAVNSTLPINFETRNPRMQVVDAASDVTSYPFSVTFDYRVSPPFPKDLGIYWFTVYNPQTEPVNITFDHFGKLLIVWLEGEETINQTFYDEYNRLHTLPVVPASISVCDQFGDDKSTFVSVEDVYVNGGGYPANTEVAIYIISGGYDLTPDNAKTATYKTTEANGTLALTLVWAAPLYLGSYDIWVDINRNDVFDYGDVCNYEAIDIFGFHVVPEIATMFSLLVMLGALATVYLARKRPRARATQERCYQV